MVTEILILRFGQANRSAVESGISIFKLSCKTINQYLSYQKKISEQSIEWLVRNCPDKIWACLWGNLRVGHFEF